MHRTVVGVAAGKPEQLEVVVLHDGVPGSRRLPSRPSLSSAVKALTIDILPDGMVMVACWFSPCFTPAHRHGCSARHGNFCVGRNVCLQKWLWWVVGLSGCRVEDRLSRFRSDLTASARLPKCVPSSTGPLPLRANLRLGPRTRPHLWFTGRSRHRRDHMPIICGKSG